MRRIRVPVAVAGVSLVAVLALGAGTAVGGGVDGGSSTTAPTTATTTRPATTVAPTSPPTTRARVTVPPVASTAPVTTQATTTTTLEEDDEKNTSATTIALIGGTILALLLIVLVIILISRRRAKDSWKGEARTVLGEAQRLRSSVVQGLATLGQPAAAAHTWSEVEDLGADLHHRFQALVQKAPGDQSRAGVTRADQALQELRSAVESDRSLRVGPPPPTQEQLGYSEAVVRQRAADFEQAVEDLSWLLRDDR